MSDTEIAINSEANTLKLQLRILLNEFRLSISFVVGRKGERKEGKRENMSGKKVVALIYFRGVNKMGRITRILRKSPVRNKSSLKGHIALKKIGSRSMKFPRK
jgi:hypothetical protein